MAYSNVTPPALPEYDSMAYPFHVLVFDYEADATDWYQAHLFYSGFPFRYDGSSITNDEGIVRKNIYSSGSWTGELTVNAPPALSPGLKGNVFQRIQTSHDIPDAAGNIYLAAGAVTPLHTFDLYPFLMGLAMGLAGKPLPLARKPIGYSYNGVVLPKLPEWDRSVFPYAYLSRYTGQINGADAYLLCVSSAPGFIDDRLGGQALWYDDCHYQSIRCYVAQESAETIDTADYVWGNHLGEVGVWTYYDLADESTFTGANGVHTGSPALTFWCNTDILNPDGSLLLAASEPIPVYA